MGVPSSPVNPVMAVALNSIPQFWRYYSPSRGPIYQFWMGIRFFWLGLSLLRQSPRLQLTSVIPIVMTGGLFSGLTWLSGQWARDLLSLIPATLPAWLLTILQTFSAGIVLLLATFFLFFPIMTVIAIPFRELLAAQTERLLTGSSSEVALPWWQVVGDVFRSLLFQVLVVVLSLGLTWFVPGVGSLLTVVILIYVAALDMVDPPLGQRGYLFPARLSFVVQRRMLMAGFGLMAILLLAVPILNLLILPIASIGGSGLVIGVLGQDTLKP